MTDKGVIIREVRDALEGITNRAKDVGGKELESTK